MKNTEGALVRRNNRREPTPRAAVPNLDPAALWRVMERQVGLYTGGDSSSVPADTARELLESVLLCLQETQAEPGWADVPLEARFLEGQRRLYRKTQEGRRLLAQARKSCLPLDSAVYRDDLEELERFFTWYDLRFFTQNVPCMMDYPLAKPVEEGRAGIAYVLDYLRQRLWEDGFCGHFAPAEMAALLARHCPGYETLPVNLFIPVLANALGRAALGLPLGELCVDAGQCGQLYERLGMGVGEEERAQRLAQAAARACNLLRLWGTEQRRYVAACAADLLPRLAAADEAGFARIFVDCG